MKDPVALTPLAQVGEFGLIQRLTALTSVRNPAVHTGPGDDCAVWRTSEGFSLITTDLLTEGVHFDLTYVPLQHLGFKAVSVNVSDVYAMMGTPQYITLSVAVSSRFTVEALEEIYRGVEMACAYYGVDLLGGDTSSSTTGMMLSLTVVGTMTTEPVLRSGLKPGHLLCVSGDVGAAYMGLQVLEREKQVFLAASGVQPQLADHAYILQRQLRPLARKDVVGALRERGISPTAMIDLSDGLASDAWHLTQRSGVGLRLVQEKLPIHEDTRAAAALFGIPATTAALYGGEDYELLFAIDPKDYDALKEVPDVRVIGYATEATTGVQLVMDDNSVTDIEALGYNHFKQGA